MKRVVTIISIILVLVLAACGAEQEKMPDLDEIIQQTMTALSIPTETPPVRVVTVLVVVTATPLPETATPQYTPTASNTPEPPLYKDKDNGFYLIGSEIGYGKWRTDPAAGNCYWAITTANGNIIDNGFGQGGQVFTISNQGMQVQLQDCGVTKFLGE